jgi:hypothetical protein
MELERSSALLLPENSLSESARKTVHSESQRPNSNVEAVKILWKNLCGTACQAAGTEVDPEFETGF